MTNDDLAFWEKVFLQVHEWEYCDAAAAAKRADEAVALRHERAISSSYREMTPEELKRFCAGKQ